MATAAVDDAPATAAVDGAPAMAAVDGAPAATPRYTRLGYGSAPDQFDPSLAANANLERYYAAQSIVPAPELPALLTSLRTSLPMTVRVCSARPQAGAVAAALAAQRDVFAVAWVAAAPPEAAAAARSAAFRMAHDAYHAVEHAEFHAWLVSANHRGLLSFQEEVSMLPPLALRVAPGQRVLDLCAAPGSKSKQLLELMLDGHGDVRGGVLVSNDSDAKRHVNVTSGRLKKLHTPGVALTVCDGKKLPDLREADGERWRFDRVLVDVPCSGDGTLRKHPLGWREWWVGDGMKLHGLQVSLLVRGIELLKPGGRLVYSTCSMNPIENEAVVLAALRRYAGSGRRVTTRELPEHTRALRTLPGLATWRVADPFSDVGARWFASIDEVPEGLRRRELVLPSRFPAAEDDAEMQELLRRCMRVLPHHNDTGGFFVTVIECLEEPKPRQPAAAAAPEQHPIDRELFYRGQRMISTEKMADEWAATADFYGLAPSMRPHVVFFTDTSGLPRSARVVSESLLSFLRALGLQPNAWKGMACSSVGMRIFKRFKPSFMKRICEDCRFRVCQEGAPFVARWATKRKLQLEPKQMAEFVTTGRLGIDVLVKAAAAGRVGGWGVEQRGAHEVPSISGGPGWGGVIVSATGTEERIAGVITPAGLESCTESGEMANHKLRSAEPKLAAAAVDDWALMRARKRLSFARAASSEGGAFGGAAARVADCLNVREIADVLRPRDAAQLADKLVEAGASVLSMWACSARSGGKQGWVTQLGVTDRKLRQRVLDATVAHREAECSAELLRYLEHDLQLGLTVVREPAEAQVSESEQFPGATVVSSVLDLAAVDPVRDRVTVQGGGRVSTVPRQTAAVPAIPEGAKVVLILGPTASGKSCLLRQYCAGDERRLHQLDTPVRWDDERAIISQFGDPDSARRWLGSVGLNAIPLWVRSHHALSTGQKIRADLARRLQAADAAGAALMLDDYTSALDRQTAAVCTCSLAKHLRQAAVTAIVASCHADVAQWLQPDMVVLMPEGSVLMNANAAGKPLVQLRISERLLDEAPAEQPTMGFRHDVVSEARPVGGTVLRCNVSVDDCTATCDAFFDLTFSGRSFHRLPQLPALPAEWSIGAICGSSGSCKTALLVQNFGLPVDVQWDPLASVVAHFGSAAEACELLQAAGLDAAVHGLRRAAELSRGEREQADTARALRRDCVYLDEFTSSLSREVAVRVARSVGGFVRSHPGKRLVVVSCHSDVVAQSALSPHWVFRSDEASLGPAAPSAAATAGDSVALDGEAIRVPALLLRLRRAPAAEWAAFRDYHYKTRALSAQATAFVAVLEETGQAVGFIATIGQIGKEPTARAHRTVVLPEWQGLGIGSRLSDGVAELHRRAGVRYLGQTVHPHFGAYRDRSALWAATKFNHTTSSFKIESWKQRTGNVRVMLNHPRFLYSHEYIGGELDDDRVAFDNEL